MLPVIEAFKAKYGLDKLIVVADAGLLSDDDLQRIEVVLGPGSALYGPNTANGVVHMDDDQNRNLWLATMAGGFIHRSMMSTFASRPMVNT